jgi:hypothetical protein
LRLEFADEAFELKPQAASFTVESRPAANDGQVLAGETSGDEVDWFIQVCFGQGPHVRENRDGRPVPA